jgi:hypothetical protein
MTIHTFRDTIAKSKRKRLIVWITPSPVSPQHYAAVYFLSASSSLKEDYEGGEVYVGRVWTNVRTSNTGFNEVYSLHVGGVLHKTNVRISLDADTTLARMWMLLFTPKLLSLLEEVEEKEYP